MKAESRVIQRFLILLLLCLPVLSCRGGGDPVEKEEADDSYVKIAKNHLPGIPVYDKVELLRMLMTDVPGARVHSEGRGSMVGGHPIYVFIFRREKTNWGTIELTGMELGKYVDRVERNLAKFFTDEGYPKYHFRATPRHPALPSPEPRRHCDAMFSYLYGDVYGYLYLNISDIGAGKYRYFFRMIESHVRLDTKLNKPGKAKR